MQKRNDSFVNKLFYRIPNPRIDLRWLKDEDENTIPKFDFNNLIYLTDRRRKVKCPDEVKYLYDELNQAYRYKLNLIDDEIKNKSYLNSLIKNEFSKLGYSDQEIANMLVVYLYGENKRYKNILWFCYGNLLVEALKYNLNYQEPETKVVQCIDCGEYIDVPLNKRVCRCDSCQNEYNKIYFREKKREYRACPKFDD